ncbi:MAG: hypothetical protein K0S29_726 [Gammaproteobacteria bacterium]|jgi:DNA repair exonuclease SbcCD ATPase subunit|nr:hypothetical protein [Gammaproteobacteria bacterium]
MAHGRSSSDSIAELLSLKPYAVTITKKYGVSIHIPPEDIDTPHGKAVHALCMHLGRAADEISIKDKHLKDRLAEITELAYEKDTLRELNVRLLQRIDDQRAATAREFKRQAALAEEKLQAEKAKAEQLISTAGQLAKEKKDVAAEFQTFKDRARQSEQLVQRYGTELDAIRQKLAALEQKIKALEQDNHKLREQLERYIAHAKASIIFNPALLDEVPEALQRELALACTPVLTAKKAQTSPSAGLKP